MMAQHDQKLILKILYEKQKKKTKDKVAALKELILIQESK